MPRHPELSVAAGAMPSSIFARLVEKLAHHRGEIFPFHLGDTHLHPPEQARLGAMSWADEDAGPLYTYGAPAGDAALVDAVIDKVRRKNGVAATPPTVQITAGATHAFACAARALLDPHDEVLLLSPYWPLIRGQLLALGARPVEVPFSSKLYQDPTLDPAALLEEYVTPRTAAIYFANPNNPDGKVLDERQLAAIARAAARADLWVFADEVYEDYTYDGRPHVSFATLPGMADRTVTGWSFSKSYGQAGLRVGYAVGPEPTIAAIRTLANHSIYSVPRVTQRAALAAMASGESFLAGARAAYAAARDVAVAALARMGLPAQVPEGGSYVFVDLAPRMRADERNAIEVLERLAAGGVLLAPGEAFGKGYATCARLCYTAVSRTRLVSGLARMEEVLTRG